MPSLTALALVLVVGVPEPIEAGSLFALVMLLTWVMWRILAGGTLYLRTVGNLLDALREGDYGVRGVLPARANDFSGIVRSFNELAARLQDEQRDVHENLQLLSKTLAALDSAVFAFEQDQRLRLVNPAGERLLGRPAQNLLGQHAVDLQLEGLFSLESGTIHAWSFAGRPGRWQITNTLLRSRSQAGRLLLVQPMERALREEEALAFRRLLRVISHEINNSITPIASMSDTLQRMLPAVGATLDEERHDDLYHGLALIGQRGVALRRFIGGYARLAKLPPPQPQPVRLLQLCQSVCLLLDDSRIVLQPGDDLGVLIDAGQMEHVFINLLRNALEAGGSGSVLLRWERAGNHALIEILDEGHGLPASGNLFVPFFTTKPEGAGIGLALSRQIVEAQQGTIELRARGNAPGTIAEVRLPIAHAADVSTLVT